MKKRDYVKKTCNYCIECGFNFPLNIQYCTKCHGKLFPVPYTPLGVKKKDF